MSSPAPRILLVNKFLYPRGGAERSTLLTARLLREHGHNVELWGMTHPENPYYRFSGWFAPHVDYHAPMSVMKKIRTALNILYSRPAASGFEKVLDAFKPDIIHFNNIAHQLTPSIIRPAVRRKIPMVMTLRDYKLVCPAYLLYVDQAPCERCRHGRFYHCLVHRCVKDSRVKSAVNMVEMYLHHRICRMYDPIRLFIAPSRFLMNKIREMGWTGDVVLLPNFLDIRRTVPVFEGEPGRLAYFGRLSREKGVATLIRAVNGLPVTLDIIGDGPQRAELEDLAAGQTGCVVRFHGHRDAREMAEILHTARFTVTPSECYENNPRSVLESFALGKPVLGAGHGGVPELIREGWSGQLFRPGDADDLRAGIQWLLETADTTAMGRNARRFVEDNFKPEDHYRRLMTCYTQVMNGPAQEEVRSRNPVTEAGP